MDLILFFFLGICVGSFLNVLIDRLPRGESVLKGRSYCESCKKQLAWYDLIPLLSFLQLKGKCRYCHISLSFYYPLVEFITGLMFALVFFQGGIMNQESGTMNFFNLAYYCFIISSFIVVFFTDLKYGIIPDKVIFSAILISIPYLFIIHNSSFIIHILSAIGAFLFFQALFLITKGKGMGFGDVKLAFLIGIFLGFPNIIIALYTAFLIGAVAGLMLIILKKKKLIGTTIPFGPFLVIGVFIALFFGNYLIQMLNFL